MRIGEGAAEEGKGGEERRGGRGERGFKSLPIRASPDDAPYDVTNDPGGFNRMTDDAIKGHTGYTRASSNKRGIENGI